MADKRISVEEVVQAYKVTGLKPKRGDFGIDGLPCCGIGAIGAKAGHASPWERRLYAMDAFGAGYVHGFAHGFDGYEFSIENLKEDHIQRYTEGYADGQAAAIAVFGPPQS